MESWKPVVGYEGLYEVSDMGRVRSLDKPKIPGMPGRGRRIGRVLILSPNSVGYLQATLSKNSKASRISVHKLVLEAFVCLRPKGKETRHLNGNQKDNLLSNLRWGTIEENRQDSRRHGTLRVGCKNGMSKLTKKQVRAVFRAKGFQREIAKRFGVSQYSVCGIKNKKAYKTETQDLVAPQKGRNKS